jgi:hypothetical protein
MKHDIKKGDMVVIIGNKGPSLFDQLIGSFAIVVSDEYVYNFGDKDWNVFEIEANKSIYGRNDFVCTRSELMKINPGTLQIKKSKAKETCLE